MSETGNEAQANQPPRKLGFWEQVKSFSGSFWTANLMEMLERLAYFGVRAVVGLFIVDAAVKGGLELSHIQRGTIFTIWALIQTLLPMFTGGFSDRYGYRKTLVIAFITNAVAYVLMGLSLDISQGLGMSSGYVPFFFSVILLATGTAIFKPPLHGTLAHVVDDRNSSLGWAFFYQLVNIGGFLGPFIAGKMRVISWDWVFFASAFIILLNLIPTLTFFKDHSEEVRRQKREAGEEEKNALATFADSMATLVKDLKFVIFLLIFSGFWLMFMQLFDTLPIYIDEWVDSRHIIDWLHNAGITIIPRDELGNLPPEMMINVNAGMIVLLMPLIGYITGKFRPILMMVVGMFISTVAIVMAGSYTAGGLVLFGIAIFSVGEMSCSPKFSEYIGLMAPPEKKALYMGYSNIPFAIGWTFAGILSGIFYGAFSDKFMLARRYMVEELGMNADKVEALGKVEVMPALVQAMPAIQNQFQATQILFDRYNPWITWVIFGAIGLAATIAMLIYHFWLEADKRKQRRAAEEA